MEPIKINIEIGVTAELAALLQGLGTPKAPAAEPAEQPKTPKRVKAEPAAAKEAAQPEAPAPEQTAEITDEQLRAAVKAAKDRTSTQTVRALFQEFGIQASSECPADKRAELLHGLNNLKAA